MNTKINFPVLTVFLLCFYFDVCSNSYAKEELKSANKKQNLTNPELIKIGYTSTCPYACAKEENRWEGYLVDILKASTSKKYNLEFVNIPLSRLLLSLKAKQIDLAILPFSSVRYESDYTISKQSLGFHYVGVLKKTSEDRYYDYSSFPKTTVVVADIG